MTKHLLKRSLLIRAERGTVFRYFTDSERFAAWWGKGSTIEGHVGGEVHIVYPNASKASGRVLTIEPEHRISFTFGYEGEGKPLAPGESLVTIELDLHPQGTLLQLEHSFDDASVRDMHLPGWRYQLALFANVCASEQHAGLEQLVDKYFEVYQETNPAARATLLKSLVTPDIRFKDAFACVEGVDDFLGHIAAILAHGPKGILERDGKPRQCQGTACVDWILRDAAGDVQQRGSNILELAADGRLDSICGLWGE